MTLYLKRRKVTRHVCAAPSYEVMINSPSGLIKVAIHNKQLVADETKSFSQCCYGNPIPPTERVQLSVSIPRANTI